MNRVTVQLCVSVGVAMRQKTPSICKQSCVKPAVLMKMQKAFIFIKF